MVTNDWQMKHKQGSKNWVRFKACLVCILATGLALTPVAAEPLVPFPTPRSAVNSTPLEAKPSRAPSQTATAPSLAQAPSISGVSPGPLRAFFSAYDKRDGATAQRLYDQLNHPVDRQIASWMIATTSKRGFSFQTLRTHQAAVKHWPAQETMRLAQERTLVRTNQPNGNTARALPDQPTTDEGKLLQVKSYLASGERTKAASLIQHYWINENFSAGLERHILRTYKSLLSTKHHVARADRLLYDERANGALRLLPLLPKADQALVKARVAVIRREARAKRLLAAVPPKARKEPGYFFARVQHLRRADKWLEAGKVMAAAPTAPDLILDGDEWWIERRLVSRKVLEAGHPKLAYKIASNHSAESAVRKVDAEFHAGWYALRFLNAPDVALKHFQTIERISDKPLSQSRALYWLARAYEANNNRPAATKHYQAASRYRQTYYGQLAMQTLGHRSLSLAPLTRNASAQRSFHSLLFVQVINRLESIGQSGRTGIFYRHLAQTMTNPAHVHLLAERAKDKGNHSLSLQIGKLALARGIDVPRLAYPLGAIPKAARLSRPEKVLAYAIARQESAFNKAAVSSADARGLMQLLPGTAKLTARKIGLSYRPSALTRDAAYNAKLGTAFLGSMIDRFGGSYILAFAAYNAGPRRSKEWIDRFGDPRLNAIDAVDWVEAIPFSETRNYVQRVMENMQVYRHRLENAPLTIKQDLNRGNPS